MARVLGQDILHVPYCLAQTCQQVNVHVERNIENLLNNHCGRQAKDNACNQPCIQKGSEQA